jgi:hypothetical protein
LRKVLSLIVIIAMLAASFIGLGTTALAANDVEFNVVSNVTELLEAGEVEFTATVTNNTGSTIYPTGILYSCNGHLFNELYDAPIANGDFAEIVFTCFVTEDMIDSEFSFSFESDAPGSSPTDTLTITRKIASIILAASGTASKTLAGVGDLITFSFALENQGEATVDEIVVSAPELNDGDPLRAEFSLVSTQSYTVVYKHTMDEEIIVNPVVTYTSGGVDQPPIVLTPIELRLESRNVETLLTVDNKNPVAGEEVTFTLRITNNGNVRYTNMKVTMNGEPVDFPANNLNPGNDYTEQYTRSYTVSTDVVFKVSLKDHNGLTVSTSSNTISIQLPVDEADLQSKLRFTMTVDRPRLTSEGTINFTGTVTNASVYQLTDISVDEETLGNVFSATELTASATKQLAFTADINETTTYNFVLTAKDRNGKVYIINAEPIEVTVSSVAPTPTPFDDAAVIDENGNELTLNNGSTGVGSLGPLGIVAIVLLALVVVVGLALLALWRRGKSSSGGSPGRSPAPRKKPTARKPVKKPSRNYRDRNNF